MPTHLPQHGLSTETVLAELESARAGDVPWREGRVFSLVYDAGPEVAAVIKEALLRYSFENGLNPTAFPSLLKFEREVVAMSLDLLGGGSGAGSVTGGGTESILAAALAAREWARLNRPSVTRPEMVIPSSAHPAFDKAAHYFHYKIVRVPVGADFRADPAVMEAAVNENTVLIAGSAPSYPQGMIDPISALGEIALRRGLWLHVDACVGGFLLPFLRRLGHRVPPFDLSVPGVCSLSADLHKYGYTAKGASVILYRTPEMRRWQFFVTTDWAGGMYASTALAGTRSGGPLAAAWAVMRYLGEDGYCRLASQVIDITQTIREGVASVPGLYILGDPDMSLMGIASDRFNIYEVADELETRGWRLDRQQFPPSLHLTIQPGHAKIVKDFVRDLGLAVAAVQQPSPRRWVDRQVVRLANWAVRALPEGWTKRLMHGLGGGGIPQRSAPLYGLVGTLPNRGDLKEMVTNLLDRMTQEEP